MNGRCRGTAAVLAAATAVACASLQVRVDYDPDEDFSALRSFAWYPRETQVRGDRAEALTPDLVAVVRPTIEKALEQQGYAKVPPGQADFFVLFHLSVERRLDTVMINSPYRLGGSEWEVNRTVREEVTVEYDEGTLIVDVLDIPARRLVWRGAASRRLGRNPRAQVVEQSVAEVLGHFPPDR